MAALRKAAVIALVASCVGAVIGGCGGARLSAPNFAEQWDGQGSPVGVVDHPEGLGVDKEGHLLVADTWNDRILRCDAEGRPASAIGKSGGGKDELLRPRGVTVDSQGNIYVVDTWNHRIQKLSPTGEFEMTIGGKGEPWGYDEAEGLFLYPYGTAVDSKGFIYVSDFNNNRLHQFDKNGEFVRMWGIEGRQDGQFNHPAGLAIDDRDRLYVADLGNDRIQRFTFNGKGEPVFDGKWGETGTKPGEFDRPYDVCVDSKGDFYVADFGNHRVQCFSAGGKLMYVLGKRGSGEGELDCPLSVAVDGDGAVYVSDSGNNRVQKFASPS
jgi:sugar lactone lactonase YvrE